MSDCNKNYGKLFPMMSVSKSDNGWKVPCNFHVFKKSLARKRTFEQRSEAGEGLY